MTIKLNHTIIHSQNPRAAAELFAALFGRVKRRGMKYWADPGQKQQGQINRHFGGRGVYFEDLSGHLLEIITKPYGDWPG